MRTKKIANILGLGTDFIFFSFFFSRLLKDGLRDQFRDFIVLDPAWIRIESMWIHITDFFR